MKCFDSHRITRWIDQEEDRLKGCSKDVVGLQYVILDMSGKHEMKLFVFLWKIFEQGFCSTNKTKTKQRLEQLIRVVQACLKKSRKTWTEDV